MLSPSVLPPCFGRPDTDGVDFDLDPRSGDRSEPTVLRPLGSLGVAAVAALPCCSDDDAVAEALLEAVAMAASGDIVGAGGVDFHPGGDPEGGGGLAPVPGTTIGG